jgi:hypothetical protein
MFASTMRSPETQLPAPLKLCHPLAEAVGRLDRHRELNFPAPLKREPFRFRAGDVDQVTGDSAPVPLKPFDVHVS